MDARSQALEAWARREAGVTDAQWSVVSGDASFRRYFRLRSGARSWIAVDAPPERENAGHFVALANALRERGVPSPRVYASDVSLGFLLLEDFGDRLLLSALTPATVSGHYRAAMDLLMEWQRVDRLPLTLPRYEPARLQTEMELFPTWLLTQHLRQPMNASTQQLFAEVMQRLLANAAVQPVVLCHRDFHSRNLMLRNGESLPGVIDFQDAVWGPVTYDLVSLLRDCYIEWPDDAVRDWALQYRDRFVAGGVVRGVAAIDDATWLRWFDWMGLQRHLKVLGIFARLYHRDGKSGYLPDLPLTLRYCIRVAERYDELAAFGRWLRQEVASRLDARGQPRTEGGH